MLEVTPEIRIPEAEIELTYVRSSGPGGQAVNKVSTKAVLRWSFGASAALPAGARERFLAAFGSRLTGEGDLLITSDRTRDRLRNREDCLEKLRGMLASIAYPPKPRKKTKPGRGARERRKNAKKRHSEKKRGRSGSWE